MKLSDQLSVKSDLMSIIESYLTDCNYSSPVEYAERHYSFDIDRYNSDDDYKDDVVKTYNSYVEKVEYKNNLIYKLCDYLYKI